MPARPVAGQPQPNPEMSEYKATVAAALEAEVSPRLDGLLNKINFKAGQFVKKGDVLFEFSTKEREINLAEAQAKQKQAEADLKLAELKLTNKKTLRTKNVASEMEFEQAQAERDVAAAKADQAQALAQRAALDLEKDTLHAPISGVISAPLVKEGAYITMVARGQSRLATIVQLDPINVVAHVPASVLLEHARGHKTLEQAAEETNEYTVILPDGDKFPHKGRIVSIAREFDPATQTAEVTVEFPNPDHLLRPGLQVTLQSSVRAE
jgi:RND family efflux transporter MFP subunit